MAVMVMMVRAPVRLTSGTQWMRDVLRQMGLATFPLYLLQDVFGASLLHGLADAGQPGHLALVLAIVIVLAAMFTVALLVELAVRNLLKPALSEAGR